MMNIKLICNIEAPNAYKWLVWGKNIGEKYFGNLMGFSSFGISPFGKCNKKSIIGFIKQLSCDCIELDGNVEEKWRGRARKLPTDTLRNFTVKEYLQLSMMLKIANVRYNKKKDEFIENKHETETII